MFLEGYYTYYSSQIFPGQIYNHPCMSISHCCAIAGIVFVVCWEATQTAKT